MTDTSEAAARQLVDRILHLSRQHDFPALLDIALNDATEPALDLLPDKATATARVQLRGAFKWQERQYERTTERLDEVRQALDAYDLTLARGILRRIESPYVPADDRERYNQLLLEVEAKAMQAEELADLAATLDPPAPPKRRWFRRR